jgi:hypothetical protein
LSPLLKYNKKVYKFEFCREDMRFKHRTLFKVHGEVSTPKYDEIMPPYLEAVKRFLTDNGKELGDTWVETVTPLLHNFQVKNNETGDLLETSFYVMTFLNQSLGIPSITPKQVLAIQKSYDPDPLLGSRIDLGIQVNGRPRINVAQARILLDDYKSRGISQYKDIVIPSFSQLQLIADANAGLALKLRDGVEVGDLALASEFPFQGRFGNDGLFGVYRDKLGDWCANGSLTFVSNGGLLVGYYPESVARKSMLRKAN